MATTRLPKGQPSENITIGLTGVQGTGAVGALTQKSGKVIGDWYVETTPVLQDGRLVVKKLTIEPKGQRVPPGGITARLLRGIKIGDFGIKVAMVRRTKGPLTPTKRADDVFYSTLARDYADTLASSIPASPIKTLAAARGVSLEKIRSQVHLARRNGFLTDTSQGKTGGKLTERALATLQRIATQSSTGGKKKD